MKVLKSLFFFILSLGLLYSVGPRVHYEAPVLLNSDIEADISLLDQWVDKREAAVADIKPGNKARIVWADSSHRKTEYALVYLHGFSASHEEGAPLHTDFARRYGMNLYLSRLEDHGRPDSNSFVRLTPENYLQSAEEAIDVAKKMGDKVIVMSCSTGSTLAVILASAGEKIHSMIMYSPNIDIYDPKSEMLLYPWGKQLSKVVMGGEYNRIQYDTTAQKYWNSIYHTNALFTMKTMIHQYMNKEHFEKLSMPVFMGYYYKDEEHQDKVVSVKRMLDFYDQISTPADKKRKMAFPNSGSHVISSHVMSKDIDGIRNETFKWAEEVLHLVPVQ